MGHTPLPWEHVPAEYLSHDAEGWSQMLSAGGIMGGTPDDPAWVIEGDLENKADAALIVRAVNSHDALVKALEEAADLLGMFARPDGRPESLSNIWARCVELEARARAALSSPSVGRG